MAETLDTKEEQHTSDAILDEKPASKKITEEDLKEPVINGGNIDEEEVNDDESSDEELGSLEKPVEILSRKRERKSTDRFSLDAASEAKPKPEDDLDYTQGGGTKLNDIPFIKYSLDKTLSEDLKSLHKLLYCKVAKVNIVKKNIRAFCGFPFDKDSPHFKKVMNTLDRFVVNGLKFVCGILGLERGGDREKLKERLIEFLIEPKDLGKPIPKKSKRSKSKAKKKTKPEKKEKKAKSKEQVGDDDVSSAGDDSDDEKTKGKSKSPEKKKKKNTESPQKKDIKKKKPTTIKIAAPKKKSKPNTPKTEKRKTLDDSDEDDEPLVKKSKSEPTNAEIKKVVSNILKDADLEQVTMKTVCRQVYEQFPEFDLTVRKDFIKTTVKEIIS